MRRPFSLAWLLLGCAVGCGGSTGLGVDDAGSSDAEAPRDAGMDAGRDAGTDAGADSGVVGPTTSCAEPLTLPAGEIARAWGGAVACRSETSLAFYEITIPDFSQMVPLDGAALPEVIGDCACVAPYHASTAGSGELVLIAVGTPGGPTGYAIERLEPNAACNYATLLATGVFSDWARLDRGGAHVSFCGDAAQRPLHYRVEGGSTVRVETDAALDAPLPFVVALLGSCDDRDLCTDPVYSDGGPVMLTLPASGVTHLMIAATEERRGISVRVRLD